IGFGSEVDHNAPGVIHLLPSLFPINTPPEGRESLAFPPLIGANRKFPYQPKNFINISGMSFGALSSNAISALSSGASKAEIFLSTGEGGLSRYHLEGGADLVFQIGPGKYGCRTPDGFLDEDKIVEMAANPKIKMFEIKLLQGAKPGKGSALPAAKVTREIAEIRGIQAGVDCYGPNSHHEFRDMPGLLKFIAHLQRISGKPVGIKLVGGTKYQSDSLAREMSSSGNIPDFIIVDGAEGGSGAAPLALADYMGLPLREALVQMDDSLRRHHVRKKTVLIASGRIATGGEVVQALALGADMINIARGFMLSMGCIQSRRCHTNRCPTGITTQNWWLKRGLDPTLKSERVAAYARTLKKDLFMLLSSCGLTHPNQLTRDHLVFVVAPGQIRRLREIYPYPDDAEGILQTAWANLTDDKKKRAA
ncbi:MAG: FMN-binding glutamate synthase family protein, partial [Bdellovibrionota bacterium]